MRVTYMRLRRKETRNSHTGAWAFHSWLIVINDMFTDWMWNATAIYQCVGGEVCVGGGWPEWVGCVRVCASYSSYLSLVLWKSVCVHFVCEDCERLLF